MPQIQTKPTPLTPTDVPGLFAWYDASNPASVSAADGASITAWNDLSGGGRHFAATGSTWHAAQINGQPAITVSGGSLLANPFFSDPANARRTIICVMKVLSDHTEVLWNQSASLWVRDSAASPLGLDAQNVGWESAYPSTGSGGWSTWYWTSDPLNYTYEYSLSHLAVDFGSSLVMNGGFTIGAGSPLEMPRSGSFQIAELIVFDRRLTWTELVGVQQRLSEKYGTTTALSSDAAVVSLGNSTTALGWPDSLGHRAADLALPVINLGFSGGTIPTLDGQEVEIDEIVGLLRAMGKKVVVTLFHGHNDMNNGGQTVVDHIKGPLFAKIRATGARILCLTTTPWMGDSVREAGRTVINDFLRSPDALNYVDAVYDLGGTPEFGVWGDGVTTGSKAVYPELWADYVHPTFAGNGRIAELVEPSFRAAVDAAPGLIVPGGVAVASADPGGVQLVSEAASGGFGPYTYQWRRDGVPIEGATSLTLDDPATDPSTQYSYDLVVTDAGGYWLASPEIVVETTSGGGPATIHEAIQLKLTELFDGGVYLSKLPQQRRSFPAVTYIVLGSGSNRTLSSPGSLRSVALRVSAWSRDALECFALAESLREGLDGFDGLVGKVRIVGCFFEDSTDVPEPPRNGTDSSIYQTVLQFNLIYK